MSEMAYRELVDAITAYLDGTLAPVDRRRFDAHLAECPHCTDYLAQMKATIKQLGRLDETELSPDTREQLLAAFRDWRAR